jgi:hypothetical protein
MNDFNPPLPPYPPAPAVPPYGYGFPPSYGLTFGQILDRIFRLVRAHLRPFMAIGLLPMASIFGLEALIFAGLAIAGVFPHPPAQMTSRTIVTIGFSFLVIFLPIIFFVYGLYYGAATYAALEADHGRKVTAAEAFRHGRGRIGRYAWLMLLSSLFISLPIFVCITAIGIGALMLGLMRSANPNPAALFFLIPLAALFYLGSIVYAIFMSLRLSLAFPACVHENLTAMQAIRRSGVLTNGAKGRIFLVLLVIYAISYVAVMILYAVGLFAFAIGALTGAGHASLTSPITIALAVAGVLVLLALVFLWSAVLMAAYSTAFAVLYRDQCLRKDGPPPVQAAQPA